MNAIFLGLFLACVAQIFIPEKRDERSALFGGIVAGVCTCQMIGGILGFYVGLCVFAFKAVFTAIRIAILIAYDIKEGSATYYKIFIIEVLALPSLLTFLFYWI